MEFSIQSMHQYTATMLIIIFMYSTIMWFLFSDDVKKIQNNFLQFMLRLEMILSSLILILGIGVLIMEPAWFDQNLIILKIILSIVAVGFIHISSIKTKRFAESEGSKKDRKKINIFRVVAIILMLTVFTLGMRIQTIADCKGSDMPECQSYQ